jgi:hypothetical protein
LTRALALIVAVFMLAAQKGDGPPVRIKAFVCFKEGRDYCGKRARSGFEPARIRLEAYLKQIPDVTDMQYGLVCAGEDAPRAYSVVDLARGTAPAYAVEHPDIGAGTCYGVAVLYRRNEKPISARSDPVLILSRD